MAASPEHTLISVELLQDVPIESNHAFPAPLVTCGWGPRGSIRRLSKLSCDLELGWQAGLMEYILGMVTIPRLSYPDACYECARALAEPNSRDREATLVPG